MVDFSICHRSLSWVVKLFAGNGSRLKINEIIHTYKHFFYYITTVPLILESVKGRITPTFDATF